MPNPHKCDNLTDEELVQKTFVDQDFFGCLIDRYENALMRYIRRITGVSLEEAEDLLQEVFIKAYTKLKSFDTDLKFSSWLYRIARNHTISAHRKKNARPDTLSADFEWLQSFASELNTERQVNQEQLKGLTAKVMDELDDKYKDVLVLKYLEDKSYQEISDILKKPMGTVSTLISRAKERFKKELKKQDFKI